MNRYSKIPEKLKALRQWLCWRRLPKKLADGNIRIGKPPINPVTGRLLVAWQEERNWLTFIQAVKYCEAGKCDGIGITFSGKESFTGIDLDKCVDDGEIIKPWAQEILSTINSYAEYSPSGNGLRLFVDGKSENVTSKVKTNIGSGEAIEVFSGSGSFLSVTGNTLDEYMVLRNNQAGINWIIGKYFSKSVRVVNIPSRRQTISSPSDHAVLDKAKKARNGTLFIALYDHGDTSKYGGDASSADMALASLLMYWTDDNIEQADRLFRSSALYRETKWDERHGKETYGKATMLRAGRKNR